MNPAISAVEDARYVILVGMAFDDTDATALQEAARIAALRPQSELHVVHAVVEQSAATATAGLKWVDGQLEEAPHEMQRRVEAMQSTTPQRVIGHVRVGGAVRAILQTAADIDADVIVVGSHQRHGLKRMILGSVAGEILHAAHCPVLVAIPKDHGSAVLSETVEPPCTACLEARKQSNDPTAWCAQHMHKYLKPHVYEPTDTRRTSMMTL